MLKLTPRLSMLAAVALTLGATAVQAKLPPPSDEAKAKAAEAAAKTAHGNKVADFQLCKSMDAVASKYAAQKKKDGVTVKPTPTPACADPGPFVYTPPTAAAAPAAPATPAAAAPAKKS